MLLVCSWLLNSKNTYIILEEKDIPVKALTKFQAVVRGFLARKHIVVIKRHNAYRSRVAKEILETENHYVESLNTCINEYLIPLQNASANPSKTKTKISAPSLQTSTIRTIFSDIKMIHTFHLYSVLNVILPRVESWNIYQCLGDIFLKIVSTATTERFRSTQKLFVQLDINDEDLFSVYHELFKFHTSCY